MTEQLEQASSEQLSEMQNEVSACSVRLYLLLQLPRHSITSDCSPIPQVTCGCALSFVVFLSSSSERESERERERELLPSHPIAIPTHPLAAAGRSVMEKCLAPCSLRVRPKWSFEISSWRCAWVDA